MSSMRDTFVIARREFLERVKSKWFVVITLIGPIGMVAMVLIPALIAGRGTAGTKVDIMDETSVISPAIKAYLETEDKWIVSILPPSTTDDTEKAKLRTKEINGYMRIPKDALDSGTITYRGDNASGQNANIALIKAVSAAVIQQRAKGHNMSDQELADLVKPPNLDAKLSNGETEGSSGMVSFLIGYILAFVLYMVITLYGVAVMRSVVQEKTSRVMELMVATVKPRSLMAGKILGVGAAGLVQVTAWLVMGAITMAYRDTILGAFGVTGGGPELPPLAFAELAIVVGYFILGFFFYASMYAAVGAMVSSEQDTQQVQMPVTMLLVVGILCLQMVSNDPRGSTAAAMTMVPFWSSMLMPMRYVLGGASLGEVLLSMGILLASTLLVARGAAKIYRVGVLMYGKRPTLRELVRWLRY